ncbi:MAG: hypothetical protein LBE35_09265 [Clostridiales bacterium]|jgi:ComF family protein|nr:hypothetical protein [Clostridiales bacterium]
MKKSPIDIILQMVFRATFPNKCIFCQKTLENVLAYNCCQENLSPFPYDDSTKGPIFRLKYDGVKTLAAPMARAIFDNLEAKPAADFLVPVPLHPNREKGRGFNQAVLLGLELSELLKIPLVGALARIRDTAPQFGLNPEQRLKNLKNAIVAKADADLKGRKIVLIDDIITTGATANECIRALHEANAEVAQIIIFAKSKRIENLC